ncbi:SGNH/GDSL hydrolase family protein [Aggregicoccus sp. 17bor-14]|uniref:SGNH/GDSL hydrolase family protein n=1 Tax=Myxococcaceae TaxID=31 RepID=UPI00129C8765|nr:MULTISPECIES: GDSL-type esterase/lipase family protein [Myxococcaceae]MBF5045286.1 SGNH/GDSL hydrolase family protein [Simulacricoccus sp. 17bor-14]MRI91027.1 SGNH/GDSL hydrolase family protein [Aggregicoccus sp. 17bor-14]
MDRGVWRWLLLAGALACGGQEPAPAAPPPPEAPAPSAPAPAPPPPPSGPAPAPVRFQPAFHQALRWTLRVESLTTFRLRVPLGRAGGRVRLAFRAGGGALQLQRASVARAGAGETPASAPLPLSFAGAPGASASAGERVVSDPLALQVARGEELFVTFEARGALAVSAIGALPGGRARSGAWALEAGALRGERWRRAVGLATLEVEGVPGPAVVAVGDSITEGYLNGADDVRKAWPGVAQARLGVPVLNAGVSGQGLYDALANLDAEVLVLEEVSDCVVLLGTNDLGAQPDTVQLRTRLARLFERLRPHCTVWAATLLPKERTTRGSYAQVREQRLVVNRWLREEAKVAGVIDLEAATRSSASVHQFAPGLDGDGIHPSAKGQRVMGEEVARFLRAQGLTGPP